MKRLYCIALIIVFLICFTSITIGQDESVLSHKNERTKYTLIIDDQASLLTDEEKTLLLNDMMPLTQYGNIVFLSTTYAEKSQHKIAHDYYYGMFGTDSGTVLLIDMRERIVYIYSDGDNLKSITNSKSEIITDNIYTFLGNGQYYIGAKEAFEEINTLLQRW